MAVMMKNSALLQVLLVGSALAAPQGPTGQYSGYNPTGRCKDHWLVKYENVKHGAPKFDPWTIESGVRCASDSETGCTLAKGFTYSKSTTYSVGGGVQVGFKLGEIWEIAPSISAGYSWTTEKGQATTAGVSCAMVAGIACALRVRPQMVKITGTSYKIPDKTYGDCGSTKYDQKSFDITSPVINGKGGNKGDEAVVEFGACLTRCDNPDACWKAYQTKIELCPGIKINDWGKQPKGNGGGNNGGNNGGGGGGRKGCDKEPGQLRGQCKPEDVGKWNCVKGESYQRCASGTWSGLTPLPAGTFCDCGLKDRSWDPANPGTNPPTDTSKAKTGTDEKKKTETEKKKTEAEKKKTETEKKKAGS